MITPAATCPITITTATTTTTSNTTAAAAFTIHLPSLNNTSLRIVRPPLPKRFAALLQPLPQDLELAIQIHALGALASQTP